tara:strand:+ start:130 stop:555 length:426 start_codon:yes stop_codon:yes gene_type:complete
MVMDDLKKKLTPIQYAVTQEDATETPYTNEFWRFDQEGIYVDIVSGEALFSSKDKFFSDCGWPAFSRPLEDEKVNKHPDFKLGYPRIEIRSTKADSHLGHVFDDGPTETGLRYCVNSASLRFIPKADLEKEGYSEYKKLFE